GEFVTSTDRAANAGKGAYKNEPPHLSNPIMRRPRADGGGWRLDRVIERRPGAVSHMPEDAPLRHRVANLGTTTAISMHVYGVALGAFGTATPRMPAQHRPDPRCHACLQRRERLSQAGRTVAQGVARAAGGRPLSP